MLMSEVGVQSRVFHAVVKDSMGTRFECTDQKSPDNFCMFEKFGFTLSPYFLSFGVLRNGFVSPGNRSYTRIDRQ